MSMMTALYPRVNVPRFPTKLTKNTILLQSWRGSDATTRTTAKECYNNITGLTLEHLTSDLIWLETGTKDRMSGKTMTVETQIQSHTQPWSSWDDLGGFTFSLSQTGMLLWDEPMHTAPLLYIMVPKLTWVVISLQPPLPSSAGHCLLGSCEISQEPKWQYPTLMRVCKIQDGDTWGTGRMGHWGHPTVIL